MPEESEKEYSMSFPITPSAILPEDIMQASEEVLDEMLHAM